MKQDDGTVARFKFKLKQRVWCIVTENKLSKVKTGNITTRSLMEGDFKPCEMYHTEENCLFVNDIFDSEDAALIELERRKTWED